MTTTTIAHTRRSSRPERPGYFDILEAALEEMLIERKIIQPGEIERQIDVLDSRTPALGAKIVARAWMDPAFRARLLADGRGTCEELGITFYDDTGPDRSREHREGSTTWWSAHCAPATRARCSVCRPNGIS